MRLIDADALKDLEEMEYTYFMSPAAVPFYEADKVWEVIDYAPTIEAEPKWISVEERMPEMGDVCLIAFKMKYPFEKEWEQKVDIALREYDGKGYLNGMWNTWIDWDEGQEFQITHWMPLPKPPAMEEEEEE